MILHAWGWCTGTTQRDGTGREEGGGFRMGNTCTSPVDLPNPGIEPRSLTLQANFLPAEPQEKSKNIGVGSGIPSPVDLPDQRGELITLCTRQ